MARLAEVFGEMTRRSAAKLANHREDGAKVAERTSAKPKAMGEHRCGCEVRRWSFVSDGSSPGVIDGVTLRAGRPVTMGPSPHTAIVVVAG